jgi:hypothetical protein
MLIEMNCKKCETCEGTGIIIEYEITPICCGNFNEDGGCCNYPIPDEIPEPHPCEECNATGLV